MLKISFMTNIISDVSFWVVFQIMIYKDRSVLNFHTTITIILQANPPIKINMKYFLINSLSPLAIASSALALALPQPGINYTSTNDNVHCSNNHTNYGWQNPHLQNCFGALRDLLVTPKYAMLPSLYPINFISSEGRSPPGREFWTPWRSSFRKSKVAFSRYFKSD